MVFPFFRKIVTQKYSSRSYDDEILSENCKTVTDKILHSNAIIIQTNSNGIFTENYFH